MSTGAQSQPFALEISPQSRFIVAGLGGVGSALLHSLCLFLNSLQMPLRLILVDGDAYAPKDRERQSFGALGNKAAVKAAEILRAFAPTELTVTAVSEYLRPDNLARIVRSGDWLFLCVDNHPSRKLVADFCQTLERIVLISGGNEGYDPPRERGTYGNVQVVIRDRGRNTTSALDKYHPEIGLASGPLPHTAGCGQLIQSVPQIVFTNYAVASAMANAFFAVACGRLTYQEVMLDILEARMLPHFPMAPSGADGREDPTASHPGIGPK